MSAAPIENKVESIEGEASIAIIEAEDPAVIAGKLLTEEEPPKTTEEEGAVNATKVPTLTKRRTIAILNPFNKPKKEETTSKGLGTFFSRSNKGQATKSEDTKLAITSELPNTEQTTTETHVETHTFKETIHEAVETVEAEVSEIVHQATTTTTKRSSFISKLFGKKTKEEQEVSSPLGKLTELFIKKPIKKTKPTEEITTPAITTTAAVDTTTTTTTTAADTTTNITSTNTMPTPAVIVASA